MKLGAIFAAALMASGAFAAPAAAVTGFETGFDSPVSGGPGLHTVTSIDGWSGPNGVLVHTGNFLGDADSPPNYVELQPGAFSSITYSGQIDPGVYSLTWLYSVHPNDEGASSPIGVYLSGAQQDVADLGQLTIDNTLWAQNGTTLVVYAPSTLSFVATGAPGQLGGYLDTVSLVYTAPVPEPGEWAMLVAGLGVIGAAASRRRV